MTPTATQHPDDPMTAEERAAQDAIELARTPRRSALWMETTYCGVWCGTYRVGDFRGSSRYRLVGYGPD